MTRIFAVLLISVFLSGNTLISQSYRSLDGKNNNVFNTEWGSAGDQLTRIAEIGFPDGIAALSGPNRPNPRDISNQLFAQESPTSDVKNLSDFVWGFGQFLDHDIIFTVNNPTENLFITIPADDKVFIPNGAPIRVQRSLHQQGTGINSPREYNNIVTSFIDGSSIYGSDQERSDWLRSFVDGKLKTSHGNHLPWNTITGEFNDPIDGNAPHMEDPVGMFEKHFVAGDDRCNENPILISMHTLFLREHNRICDELKAQNPDFTDEELFQHARRWVGAYLQSIVYNEWLPSLGIKVNQYIGYHQDVIPQISNEFSVAAFRVGHTLINGNLLKIVSSDPSEPVGAVSLRNAFFNPTLINLSGGIESFLRGMGTQVQQKMDNKVVDDVRNFLFGPPEAGGLDLAAINILRGRERGLPDYNTLRQNIGLPRIKQFGEITKHHEDAIILQNLYGSVDDVDPWVGMLSEDYMPDAILGSTLMKIIKEQFEMLRDGDRFFYLGDRFFSEDEKELISTTTLHDIIMRNSDIDFMQSNVFEAMPLENLIEGPELTENHLQAIAYPNPTSGPFDIKVYVEQNTQVDVLVYDQLGRRVFTDEIDLTKGNSIIPVDMAGVDGGSYYNIVIYQDQLNYQVLRVVKL